jgi:MazG family protein
VSSPDISAAVARLDELTRRLRRECPWDREQDERTIVPHTVEEAYELADAAQAGDDAKLLDELGDVLFQVHFLALLLEERGSGDLAAVAERCAEKLVRRHPHVFGDAEARSAAEVLRNWDAIKRGEAGREPGTFADVPENLPALLLARKVQRRAASAGLGSADLEAPLGELCREVEALAHAPDDPEARFGMLGAVLFAVVHLARTLRLDPELALRAAAQRFREAVETDG